MKNIVLCFCIICGIITASAQSAKTELYDLIKKIIPDSTGYENVGDWDITTKFPVKWSTDRIEMSDDTSINFFRRGTAAITINDRSFMQAGQPVKWSILIKGPRMGYTSFSIISSSSGDVQPRPAIENIFGKKPFTAKLLKSCDTKPFAGFYYYEVKLPKKDITFMKLSWISINGNTAIRIDCFDNFSKYAAKIDCK